MPHLSLHEFIRELEASETNYALTSVREGAIMVQIALPGERWEVEFFDSREPELEVFRSDGEILGANALRELLTKVQE